MPEGKETLPPCCMTVFSRLHFLCISKIGEQRLGQGPAPFSSSESPAQFPVGQGDRPRIARGTWIPEGRCHHQVPVTTSLLLLPTRSKAKAIQNGTFKSGAMVVSGVRSDCTSQEDEANPWGGYRGQPWAVPVTWPPVALWSVSAQHQQALRKPLMVSVIPPAWTLLLLV